ncbi:hypothetical protein B0187_09580 [Haemophilus paracuniculus]|uniref:Uncharacterized protein n=1 Tax=Haemophilus paracuniculus TaxID=734 RepID=A0A1T0AQ30_9PAST|nr:hypothetical protein B0187_09580 [Haemophilus paracuniculus]
MKFSKSYRLLIKGGYKIRPYIFNPCSNKIPRHFALSGFVNFKVNLYCLSLRSRRVYKLTAEIRNKRNNSKMLGVAFLLVTFLWRSKEK